jgi:hypothetical protein
MRAARLLAAVEEHAGGDDGDDMPGEPKPGRGLAQEEAGQGAAALLLRHDDGRGREGGRQAREPRHQGAGAARGEQAQHQEEGQEGEKGGHGRRSIACPAGRCFDCDRNAVLRRRRLSLKPAAVPR